MGDNFRTCKIGDVFELTPGYAFKSSDFVKHGVPVIKIKNVKAGEIVLDSLSFVEAEIAQERKNFLINHDDILITLSGNRIDGSKETWVGKVSQFRKQGVFLLNQRVALLRPKNRDEIDSRYCAYLLGANDFQTYFISIATSSGGQANLSSSQVLNATMHIPALKEQQAIASILGTLDDKIELNRQRNRTLEAMARALFQSWFVVFDPVKAKAAGKNPPGLKPEIAALFPDSFEESELGMIPKGWTITRVGSVLGISRESITPGEFPDELFDHYSIPAYDQTQHPKREPGFSIKSQKFVVPKEAVLVSKLNPKIPRIWIPELTTSVRSLASTEFLVCVASKGDVLGRSFLYCLSRDEGFSDYLISRSSGTSNSHQRVRPEDFLSYQIVAPIDKIGQAFERLMNPMLERILLLRKEFRTISTIRDSLLPKLISGELSIPDAERIVSRMV
jgi:type I restriction enzyme S subunit